MLNAIANIQP